jgi:hypothetical protein
MGVSAQLKNASLEAVARPKRRIEEHHKQRASFEKVGVPPPHRVVLFESQTDLKHGLDFSLIEVSQGDEIAPL